MKGMVSLLLMAIVVGLIIFLLVGVSSNYTALPNDLFGIGSVINAITITISEIITITNLTFWTFAFFGVQGIFLYIYYRIGRLLWVRIPQVRLWLGQMEEWLQ